MKPKTIYMAIFGRYDELKEPRVITPGWRYVCFTDQDFKSDTWEIIKRPLLDRGQRHTSKYYKIMFHEVLDADLSIWVDGSFVINCNLDRWVSRHFRSPMTAPQHPGRSCVYKEAEACIRNRRDREDIIRSQVRRYRILGVPAAGGMIASGILVRRRCDQTIDFSQTWWEELCRGSARDQISFGYAVWKHPIVHYADYNYKTGSDFIIIPHIKHKQ